MGGALYLSISTANFYQLPFPQALAAIRRAGFDYVELGTFWEGGDDWAAAQHLRDVPPAEVLAMVRDSGLRIATLHDLGGVIEDGRNSIVAPDTHEYLALAGDEIPCVVLHTPHCRTADPGWWRGYRPRVQADLRALAGERLVCIENMLAFPGYTVPLLDPAEMLDFAAETGVYVNMDSTHYAQCGLDPRLAAETLWPRTRTVHLSDYDSEGGRAHLFPGRGELDLGGFLARLDLGPARPDHRVRRALRRRRSRRSGAPESAPFAIRGGGW
jgi:sugar phosphate isomerase/epimerase